MNHFPPDVLGQITPFLVSVDIGRLLMCGDKHFNARLLHPSVMRSFHLDLAPTRPLQKFPNFARLLPGLKELYIGDESCSQCFHDTTCVPLTYLPHTLERLELSFWEAETWFLASPSGRPLAEDSAPSYALPSTFNHSKGGMSFPYLRTLILNGTPTSRPFHWNFPSVAPNLETLVLHTTQGISGEHLIQLPASITELRLPRNISITPWTFHLLPPALTSLQLNNRVYGPTPPQKDSVHDAFRNLPSGLLQLDFAWDSSLKSDVAGSLPRSLTALTVWPAQELLREWALLLPRQLRSLCVIGSDWSPLLPSTLLHDLPPQLELLSGLQYVDESREEDFSNLPISLTELVVNSKGNQLSVDGAQLGGHLANLHGLTKLSLAFSITNPKPFVEALPTSLCKLSLHIDFITTDITRLTVDFAPLENLEQLTLHIWKNRGGYSREIFTNFDWLILPQRKLKSLSILGVAAYTGDKLEKLLPKTLTALELEPTGAADFFYALPEALVSLKIHSYNQTIDPVMIALMPQKIKHLELKNMYGFADAILEALPRSLTSLHLGNSSFTPHASLKLLPPNITALTCADPLMYEWEQSRRKPNVITI